MDAVSTTFWQTLGITPTAFYPVLGQSLLPEDYLLVDMSAANAVLNEWLLHRPEDLDQLLAQTLQEAQARVGWGGYGENRQLYRMDALFNEPEPRTIHLGIDLWAAPGTEIYVPLRGTIHSLADHHQWHDYGPTIILRHDCPGGVFWSLYGHLSRKSLENKLVGQTVEAGELLAWIGTTEENVGWVPHLHLQCMRALAEGQNDYQGVAARSQASDMLYACPDPQPLTGIP